MGKTILLIEDEKNLVELLKFRLEANGYSVETAFDGEEGLKKIKKGKADLVILDVMMPKMHGYDVCKAIRQNKNTRAIPIIILTAHVKNEDKKKAIECGANSFMAKPFESAKLLEEIEKLIT